MRNRYMRTNLALSERINNSYLINDKGCWIWQKTLSAAGYGVLTIGSRADGSRRLAYAHRVSFELFKGDLDPDLSIDHLCRTTTCINPDHLEQVTIGENVRRGFGKWKQNASKTYCIRGHKYTEDNTRKLPSKFGFERRQCRSCEPIWRARKLRRKQMAGAL